MAIVLIHDPNNAVSTAYKNAYGSQCDSIETPDAQGNPPIPYLQGYPSVMYDVPAYNQAAQVVTNTNPDGTTYQVTIPAYNVPASKAIIYNPPDFATVQAAVAAAQQRAATSPPTTS
jgi:hypothetical protein